MGEKSESDQERGKAIRRATRLSMRGIAPPQSVLPRDVRKSIAKALEKGIPKGSDMAQMLEDAKDALEQYWFSAQLEDHDLPKEVRNQIEVTRTQINRLNAHVIGMHPYLAKRFFRYLGDEIGGDDSFLTREETGTKVYVAQLRPICAALEYTKGRMGKTTTMKSVAIVRQLLLDLAYIWPQSFEPSKFDRHTPVDADNGGMAFFYFVIKGAAENAADIEGLEKIAALKMPRLRRLERVLEECKKNDPIRPIDRSGGPSAQTSKAVRTKIAKDVVSLTPAPYIGKGAGIPISDHLARNFKLGKFNRLAKSAARR